MLTAALFCLVAGPVQERYGVFVLGEGVAKARPFGRLRAEVQGITAVDDRAYLWTERGLWWTDSSGKRLVRVKGLPFADVKGESRITYQTGLEPGGGLLAGGSDGRLWRIKDKARLVPGLPKDTEVTAFAPAIRHTFLATDRGIWCLDEARGRVRPVPGLQRKITGITALGEGALVSTGQSNVFLCEGNNPPTPKAGADVDAHVVSDLRWDGRALIHSEEGLWSLAASESKATPLPGSEKMGSCLDFAVDGRRIWGWGGIEGTLRVYDADRRAVSVVPKLQDEITCLLVRPNEVLVGTYFNGLFRVDKRTLAVRKIPFTNGGGGTISDIVPFGKRVLIGTRRGMSH